MLRTDIKSWLSRSFFRRQLLTLASLLLLSFCVLLYMCYTIMVRQQQGTRLIAISVENYINHAAMVLQALSQMRADQLELDATQKSYPFFLALYAIGPDGNLRAMSPPDTSFPPGSDMSMLSFYRKGRYGLYISKPFMSIRTATPTIYVSQPGINGFGIVGELNLEDLQRHVEQSQYGLDGNSYIIDSDGFFLASPDKENVRKQLALDKQNVKAFKGDGVQNGIYQSFDTLVFGTSNPIGKYGWFAISETALLYFLMPFLAWLIAGFLAVFVLGFVMVRKQGRELERELTVPLMSLCRQAGLIADGQYQNHLEADNHYDRFQELRSLADSFDHMRHAILVRNRALRRDEAELRRLVHELGENNAELERFTYTVSHDLKSPLVTIKGFLGYLEAAFDAGDRKSFSGDITRITRAADTMQSLLDDLLQLSRIGRIQEDRRLIDMGEIVQEALAVTAGILSIVGVQVKVADDLPARIVDRKRIVEVFQNLIDNAAKFMGGQTNPQIEIGYDIQSSEFIIRDNGIGISPEYHDRVFNLFEQLNKNIEGSGIGLALVKRIIEVHGGTIRVESAGLGFGSCFRFTIPYQVENDADG